MGTTITLLYFSLSEIFYSTSIYILISFFICYSIIPIIIKKAISNNWVDQPNARKVHTNPIPSFGGIGIFIAITIAWFVPVLFDFSLQILVIWFAGASLFAVAILDDLIDLSPKVRFLVQLLASLLIANVGIRIESLYGLFGIHELSLIVQYVLTVVIIAGFINAFNFIDGIDGLAGGLGCINAIVLGIILTMVNQPLFATLSFILATALLAFLSYWLF